MERRKQTTLLLCLCINLLHVCASGPEKDCPSQPDENISCYNDYNRTITCEWNGTPEDDHGCRIEARKEDGFRYDSHCVLQPVNVSRPGLKKCSMIFSKNEIFQTFHNLTMTLTCNQTKKLHFYLPKCHIKLDPPPKPEVNSTKLFLVPHRPKGGRGMSFRYELQWKHVDQSWTEAKQQIQYDVIRCEWNCSKTLRPELLIKGKEYVARLRVEAKVEGALSDWSGWSSTASLGSVGTKIESPSKDASGLIIGGVVVLLVVLALLPAVMLLKSNNTVWVYIGEKIKGRPLPNPKDSSLKDETFQNWLSPHFNTIMKSLDIVSVEIASPVEFVAPHRPEEPVLEKVKSYSSCSSDSSSSFSNPSYAHLVRALPPPAVLLASGNLDPCSADSPYGPVCSQNTDKDAKQESGEERSKDLGIAHLLSEGSNNSKPVIPIISDYEKVEKLERSRLQSLDSGVCSGEEVSQESVEADSINVTDEGMMEKDERKGGDTKVDFHKLLGVRGDVFSKGSIQVCCDYERVQKLLPDTALPEPQGFNLEHSSHEESLDEQDSATESTTLLFPPPIGISHGSCLPVRPLSLSFGLPAMSQALQPQASLLLDKIALMSTSSSVEPPGDGYLPVKQEQS